MNFLKHLWRFIWLALREYGRIIWIVFCTIAGTVLYNLYCMGFATIDESILMRLFIAPTCSILFAMVSIGVWFVAKDASQRGVRCIRDLWDRSNPTPRL